MPQARVIWEDEPRFKKKAKRKKKKKPSIVLSVHMSVELFFFLINDYIGRSNPLGTLLPLTGKRKQAEQAMGASR